MAGIYLHIPFCRQACTYCNFHFSTSLRYKDELIRALVKEIEAEKDYLGDETIQTIYFGGGTPSLLQIEDCRLIIDAIRENFTISENAEITLEANPDDIDLIKLRGWKEIGINRLSIGVQSFFEEELKWMNRVHNALQAKQCIEWCRQAGINNLSIDLIYGSPLLTDEMWKQNVNMAIDAGITHLSCYALTVEEKTPLFKLIKSDRKTDIDPDKQARQFLLLMDWLKEKGFEHYEVSNFARPGNRSRHNSSYWKGEKYLGIGPSAHSYNGMERRWNIANNTVYTERILANKQERETECLTPGQRLNEYVMISLRTAEGIDLNIIERNWGINESKRIGLQLQKYINSGLVKMENSMARLTNEGMLMADGIAGNLFLI